MQKHRGCSLMFDLGTMELKWKDLLHRKELWLIDAGSQAEYSGVPQRGNIQMV